MTVETMLYGLAIFWFGMGLGFALGQESMLRKLRKTFELPS